MTVYQISPKFLVAIFRVKESYSHPVTLFWNWQWQQCKILQRFKDKKTCKRGPDIKPHMLHYRQF
jgi:hypothetical protein